MDRPNIALLIELNNCVSLFSISCRKELGHFPDSIIVRTVAQVASNASSYRPELLGRAVRRVPPIFSITIASVDTRASHPSEPVKVPRGTKPFLSANRSREGVPEKIRL